MWHALPKHWSGEVAANLYRGAIAKTLQKVSGDKDKYLVGEDNDRTGYKSGKALEAKREVGIKSVDLPKYSPDLNPLDFYVWSAVEKRMAAAKVKQPESAKKYIARLRRTALKLPEEPLKKAVLSMKSRIQAVYDAKGRDIARD